MSVEPLVWNFAGYMLMMAAASLTAWKHLEFWNLPNNSFRLSPWPMIGLVTIAYWISATLSVRLTRFPHSGVRLVLAIVAVSFLCIVLAIALARFYYSRPFLLVSFACTAGWVYLAYAWRHPVKPRFALVEGPGSDELLNLVGPQWQVLQSPKITAPVDAVVMDLHEKLGPEWVRFLADCSLNGVPVYHSAVVYERHTGRVSIRHLSEGLLADIAVPAVYSAFKRIVDIGIVVGTLPLTLPLVLLTAIAIRLESRGPVLFWQTRVGQRGEPFQIVKFRSMRLDAESGGSQFASNGDDRCTRVGRFIRKFRIDELPQFLNILKGEMSLVGPRPEQVSFVKQFEEEIPFYAFRHLVKPGLTGWAQVSQGYAADTDQTRVKLEFDLFYIKHLSTWLDIFVVFKTLRTILTGFGAR